MNSLGVGNLHRAYKRGYIKVTIRAPGRAYADGAVGEPRMQSLSVGLRIDGKRAYTPLFSTPYYPYRYLASVGDENFIKHPYPVMPVSIYITAKMLPLKFFRAKAL